MTPDERAQIRAEAVREAATWLIYHVCDMLDGPDELNDGHHIARANAIQCAAKDMERALLRPDPAEASEPLQSARSVTAPVDHGPGAVVHVEAGTLHEATVRACIAALEAHGHGLKATRIIAALLPKPDPAKQLVDEWLASIGGVQWEEAGAHTFAQWIIETGRLKV